jgi:TolB-like protein
LALGLCCVAVEPAAAGPARVVILPVVVHSAASDAGYVSRGLSDMLSARLEQLGGVDVVRADGAHATARLSEALATARDVGGDFVLFGSFTQFGDGASLDVQCAPVAEGASAARTIFIQSGTMAEIIPKLDDLADKVARYVRGEPVQVGAPATNGGASAEALDDLKRRLDALERAVFPPVAGAGEESDGAGEDDDVAPES